MQTSKKTLCPDEECLRQTLHGNPAGFEKLVARYSTRLLRFIAGRVPSLQDSEDICQETFLKAYRALSTFDLRCSFKTWLFTIAYHETISFLRKKKVPTCSALPETDLRRPQNNPSPLTSEEIWTAARTLGPDQYTLLWLKYKEDLSIPELAAINGKSRLHIRVLLHRARKKLADILNPPPPENSARISNLPAEASCSIQGESHVL